VNQPQQAPQGGQYAPQQPGQQQGPQQGAQGQYQGQPYPILLSTMNDLPGYQVVRVFGEVFGLTVRSRNMFSTMGAGFKAMAGGELKGLSKLLSDSRHEALGRLAQEAMAHGANAVLALRFDCNEIANTASEIAAYGTAVYVVPTAQR
jgi:uncharacterized protein YbjQ (UPF0145 family)